MKIEQFLHDPGFENWARQVPGPDYERWQSWRKNHPEQAGLMDEAKSLFLLDLDFVQTTVPKQIKRAEWNVLSKRIGQPEKGVLVRPMQRRQWLAAAAAILLLVAAGWWLLKGSHYPELLTEATDFGEIKTLELPDGSLVTLNANSAITFPKNWKKGMARDAELRGEAFFEVKHLPDSAPFTVAAGDLEVEVLGTSFNVRSRGEEAEVSLVEGKVGLKHVANLKTTVLAPGQTAHFDRGENGFEVSGGLTEKATSWKDHLWVFDKTPLADVLHRIEDEFGLRNDITQPQLLEKNISGRVSTSKKEVLLRALEALLDVEIIEENGVLKIDSFE